MNQPLIINKKIWTSKFFYPSPQFFSQKLNARSLHKSFRVAGVGHRFSGLYNFILLSKLKALKSNLKVWNHEVFDNVTIKKGSFKKGGIWDAKKREAILDPEKVEARSVAREDYYQWALLEQASWR